MYLALIVLATVAVVVYANRKGWYSFSEYAACFGAGWIVGLLLNMVQ